MVLDATPAGAQQLTAAQQVLTFRRSLEMTTGREEFVRLFSSVVPSFDVDGETIRWACFCSGAGLQPRGPSGTIRLLPLPNRTVGGLSVPRHRVEISLDACGDAEGEAFMARFHRAFLRGGG